MPATRLNDADERQRSSASPAPRAIPATADQASGAGDKPQHDEAERQETEVRAGEQERWHLREDQGHCPAPRAIRVKGSQHEGSSGRNRIADRPIDRIVPWLGMGAQQGCCLPEQEARRNDDSSFAVHELAHAIAPRATLISRLRLNASLFAPPAKRSKRRAQKGLHCPSSRPCSPTRRHVGQAS